jgi:S1-C subfamily serine protease
MVMSVEPGGPAAEAGLRPYDIVVEYGETPVGGVDDLHRILTEDRVGAKSELTVVRGSERLRMTVVPSKLP